MPYSRIILFIIAVISVLTGVFIFAFPQSFYDMIPGLNLMGPFSIHFIRDVGLAYISSGAALYWGTKNMNRPVAIAGASWPFLHALFHIQIWIHRGLPFDQIFAVNLFGVILIGFIALGAAIKLRPAG